MNIQKIDIMNKNQQKTLWQRITNPFEKKSNEIVNETEVQDANLEFLRRMNIEI